MPQSVCSQLNPLLDRPPASEGSPLEGMGLSSITRVTESPQSVSITPIMSVTFWGVRGSIASQGASTMRYGGNTSCVDVRLADGSVIIFDAGTGLHPLGNALLAPSDPVRAHLFISHLHWDHIQGLPFFAPAYIPSSTLTLLGPPTAERPLQQLLADQMRPPYFPVTMDAMAARLSFHHLYDGSHYRLPGATVEAHRLNHPRATLGYRLTVNDKILVYATDNEPYGDKTRAQHLPAPSGLLSLAKDADVLIMDAQYTPEEYPHKVGWGHSTYMDALRLAQAAHVKQLVLFHHDPSRSDHELDTIVTLCNAWSAKQGCDFTCVAAAEGVSLQV